MFKDKRNYKEMKKIIEFMNGRIGRFNDATGIESDIRYMRSDG
jgi:hypothetical protein